MIDIAAIAARTKIASFSGGRPRFTRKHKPETEKVNKEHNTGEAAAVQVKQCEHPILDEWETVYKEALAYHKSMTRPTIDDGNRLLPVGKEFEYMQAMAKFHQKAKEIADRFMAIYPQLRAEAPTKLNGLYDPGPWKEAETIAAKFRNCETRLLPCPIIGEWKDWLQASATAADMELKEELEKRIRHAAERCASPGRLYQSVFDNIKEMLGIDSLTDDPKIKAIMESAREIADQDKDMVVKHPKMRKEIAEEANRILSMF